MKICKNCIQPDSRPKIHFNDDGICGACLWENEKKNIDWAKREEELIRIVQRVKQNSSSNYDCVIGVSGGKDSTLQAIYSRDKLGLNCLLVNGEPENITKYGKHNIENLKNLGFDVIGIRPNPKITKKLMKYDFFTHLNPQKATEYSLWSSSYIIAEKFDIPLIIQGENPALTLGVSLDDLGKGYDALLANKQNTLSSGIQEYIDNCDVSRDELSMFYYNDEILKQKNITGIWLQYFYKDWSLRKNAEFSKKHGFKDREDFHEFDPNQIGTYVPFSQLDSDLIQVNQMLKFIKFGFGQCLDHVCYDLRDGLISKNEAIDLVKKYDGKCDEKFVKDFCNFLEIPFDDFWKTVDKFRGSMWYKQNTEWRNKFWDMLEN